MELPVYVAGPFFNSRQIELIRQLETTIEACGFNARSPHRDGLVIKPNDPPEVGRKGFDWNIDEIRNSIALIAITDWLTTTTFESPLPHEIREVNWPVPDDLNPYYGPPTKDSPTKICKVFSPPLNITDTGTAFEMGCAFLGGVPVITLSVNAKQLNLMLVHAVVAHCAGAEAFTQLAYVLDRIKKYAIDPFIHSPHNWLRHKILEFARADEDLKKLRHKGPII